MGHGSILKRLSRREHVATADRTAAAAGETGHAGHPLGSSSVISGHVYTDEGTYTTQVFVTASTASTTTATGSAIVADAPLAALAATGATSGLRVSISAGFADADPFGTLSDYTATIDWGDGTPPAPASIVRWAGWFAATGAHQCAAHGTYTATVTIRDAGGSSVSKQLTIRVQGDGHDAVQGSGS